uniref:TclM n=1 Tax=Macrococcoides caseolyticum TaxID=69966 RepID=A0A097PTA6_9STAP|nr:hypothetical protein [Macrococcus caseolyticus]AIU53948.1 TclM [Macrococcus caseolyticus]
MKTKVINDFLLLSNHSNDNSFYFLENDKLEIFNINNSDLKKTKSFMGDKSDEYLSIYLNKLNDFYENMMYLQVNNYSVFQTELFKFMINYSEFNYESLERGMISYCSHSEGFLSIPKNQKFKKIFKEGYLKNEHVLDLIINNRKDSFFYTYHIDTIISELKPCIRNSIKKNEIHFLNIDHSKNNDQLTSDFHQHMLSNEKFLKFMRCDIDFLTSRFLTIAQYFLLKNMGISNINRYFTCYLTYKSLSNFTSKNPNDLIKYFKED